MPRTSWTMIRDTLLHEIAEGVLRPGDRLPTEPQLAARFGAGRHSVRRAVDAMAMLGKVSIEQGRGTFVEEAPRLTYTIGKRTRLRHNLLPQGCKVSGKLLGSAIVDAPAPVRRALDLEAGARVVESQRLTLADEMPVAFGWTWHPADRFPDFATRRESLGSTTETYRSYGVADYFRHETELYARPAKAQETTMLKQHPGLPVIVSHAVDVGPEGRPLSTSRVIWAAGRVKFIMTGTQDDRD
ncbi:MAG TPA: phosphonate metabolism transcriptional regulator PhnF [Rhodobacterales bacterium]|nr:phosphonate metabolism transcriptional regulator PhnF [Rhodobacterales bacterium]